MIISSLIEGQKVLKIQLNRSNTNQLHVALHTKSGHDTGVKSFLKQMKAVRVKVINVLHLVNNL